MTGDDDRITRRNHILLTEEHDGVVVGVSRAHVDDVNLIAIPAQPQSGIEGNRGPRDRWIGLLRPVKRHYLARPHAQSGILLCDYSAPPRAKAQTIREFDVLTLPPVTGYTS